VKKQLQEAISEAGLYGFTVEYLKKEFLVISEGLTRRVNFVIFPTFKIREFSVKALEMLLF